VLVAHDDLELLSADAVGLRPVAVVLLHDIGLLDDPPGLAEDGGGDEDLLADHGVVLVVGVVGVAELAVGAELELEELVPELALVPHVVPQVELALARARVAVLAVGIGGKPLEDSEDTDGSGEDALRLAVDPAAGINGVRLR
jgi:hypothetical protein